MSENVSINRFVMLYVVLCANYSSSIPLFLVSLVSHFPSYPSSKTHTQRMTLIECCIFLTVHYQWKCLATHETALIFLLTFFSRENFPDTTRICEWFQLPLLFLYGLTPWHMALNSVKVTHATKEINFIRFSLLPVGIQLFLTFFFFYKEFFLLA